MSVQEADQNGSNRLTWLIVVKGIPGFSGRNYVLHVFCDWCC